MRKAALVSTRERCGQLSLKSNATVSNVMKPGKMIRGQYEPVGGTRLLSGFRASMDVSSSQRVDVSTSHCYRMGCMVIGLGHSMDTHQLG